MERNYSDQSIDESNAKRPKIESDVSTSSKPESKDPFISLPSDIFTKIIAFIPVAQWPALELLDKKFRAATLIAWRQLRSINLDQDLLIKRSSPNETITPVESILQKLLEHSPFLKSLSGITIKVDDAELNSDVTQLLAQFEYLQSITFGETVFYVLRQRGIPLGSIVDFLLSTRSRTSLKDLRLFNIVQGQDDRAMILDNFTSSFVNGREIQSPLQLEKFLFTSYDSSLNIRLNTLDTTRLIELCVGKASIEPQQLVDLIERAPSLRRIELSFMNCCRDCNAPRLQDNERILTALASGENLQAIKFECLYCNFKCKCSRFQPEFIDMLKSMGRRHQLRKLAVHRHFPSLSTLDMNEIGATIRNYIPYLQSLKVYVNDISDESVFNLLSLTELEELHFSHWNMSTTVYDAMKKIAQLPRLKRLALDVQFRGPENLLEWLADVTTLTDVRITSTSSISADVFDKWSEGFASNLEILMMGEIHPEPDEKALAGLLKKATRLRVLILNVHVTDETLKTIAESCPKLETLGVYLASSNETTVQYVQEIVDRCSKLKRLGAVDGNSLQQVIWDQLHFPKYRKIDGRVDRDFWEYDFDDDLYD